MNSNQKKLVGLKLYLVMLGMLIAGTCNTILMKFQNKTGGVDDVPFNHPYVQCAVMFLGETLCLLAYVIKTQYQKRQAQHAPMSPGTQAAGVVGLKTDINPLLLAIPACFDIVASTLMNIALTMVAASVYQMLRGTIIIITAGMSILFLKRILYRHHWSAIAVIFTGVFLVGLNALLFSDSPDKTNAIGLVLLVISQLFSGGMFIVEEKLLGDYYLDPLKVVGWEGVWGVLMYCIFLPIFQFIKCDSQLICPYGVVEDTKRAFEDYGANPVLIILSICICFSIASFNAFGVAVTKNASAAQRSTIDTSRTVLIWIFFMIVPVYGIYLEHFSGLQLGGFILLSFGTLWYNEIIVLPILGFNKYTKEALKKKELEKQHLIGHQTNEFGDNTYTAVSPHAGYDAQRGKRIIERKMNEALNKTTTDGDFSIGEDTSNNRGSDKNNII